MKTLEVIILNTQRIAWREESGKCTKIVNMYQDVAKRSVVINELNEEQTSSLRQLEELLSSTRTTMYRYVNHDKIVCT